MGLRRSVSGRRDTRTGPDGRRARSVGLAPLRPRYRGPIRRGLGLSEAETNTVQGTFTILFTDLEGSTDLRVRVGDSTANEIIRLHDDLVRSRLEIAGAAETKSLGDGFMALFTSANRAISPRPSTSRAWASMARMTRLSVAERERDPMNNVDLIPLSILYMISLLVFVTESVTLRH